MGSVADSVALFFLFTMRLTIEQLFGKILSIATWGIVWYIGRVKLMDEEKDFKSKILELIESMQDEEILEYLYWYITLKFKAGQ